MFDEVWGDFLDFPTVWFGQKRRLSIEQPPTSNYKLLEEKIVNVGLNFGLHHHAPAATCICVYTCGIKKKKKKDMANECDLMFAQIEQFISRKAFKDYLKSAIVLF
jgi:hypothetical protein